MQCREPRRLCRVRRLRLRPLVLSSCVPTAKITGRGGRAARTEGTRVACAHRPGGHAGGVSEGGQAEATTYDDESREQLRGAKGAVGTPQCNPSARRARPPSNERRSTAIRPCPARPPLSATATPLRRPALGLLYAKVMGHSNGAENTSDWWSTQRLAEAATQLLPIAPGGDHLPHCGRVRPPDWSRLRHGSSKL